MTKDGTVATINSAAERMTRWRSEEAISAFRQAVGIDPARQPQQRIATSATGYDRVLYFSG